jgi:catechol 2,3-dioxygenase-like lactoylglutathione lyase family enzyme
MELQMTMIFAKDIERMTAFYRDGLGLRALPERSSEGWVVLDAGGALLALHEIPSEVADGIAITDPPRAREETPMKLVFHTSDMDQACARLETIGATLLEPRVSGARDVLDPEGNVLQLKDG